MKILLVANYEPDAQQSMLRYAEFLRRELTARGHAVTVLHPPVVAGRLVGPRNPLAKWLGYLDKFVLFRARLRRTAQQADLVHVCDHSNSNYLKWAGNRPKIITVHDLLAVRSALGHFPQTSTGATGKLLQRWILSGLESARHIIAVSHKTKNELAKLLISKPEIQVIHLALNWSYEPASMVEIESARTAIGLKPGEEYLLHVGGNQWYKNRLGVLKIALALRSHERFRNVKLVLAGKPWTTAMREFCHENNFTDVIELVAPPNEQVRALYSGASAFLFPSLEEGFGWPILEAQACGALVVTTNRAPMTEVAGKGAILVSSDDPAAAAQTIVAQFADAESIKGAARENLLAFTKEKMLDRYEEAYAAVVADFARRT